MTPIPLDELAESTPLNAPIRPSFNTTTIPLSLDATVEPSPVTLGVISSERSGLGTLILTVIAVAISVAVIVQGIVIWKSRRFRSELTLLVFLANDVLGRQADSGQQGAAGQPVASSSHLKNPSPSRRQAASPPHQQGATTPGQEVTPPPRRRNVSRRSGLRLAQFIKHTKSILHLGKRAPPPRQDTPSEQSAPNEQDTPGEQGSSNGQGGSGGPGGSGGQAATDTLPARLEIDLEAIHRCIKEMLTAMAHHHRAYFPLVSAKARKAAAIAESSFDSLWLRFTDQEGQMERAASPKKRRRKLQAQ